MKRFVITAALTVGCCIPLFSQAGTPEQVLEKYNTSLNMRDLTGTLSTFDQDATLFPSSGAPRVTGKKEIEQFFAKFFDNTKRIDAPLPASADFQRYGDVVIRTGKSNLAYELKDGSHFGFPIRTTFVVKKEGSDWHIVHMHISKENSPPK